MAITKNDKWIMDQILENIRDSLSKKANVKVKGRFSFVIETNNKSKFLLELSKFEIKPKPINLNVGYWTICKCGHSAQDHSETGKCGYGGKCECRKYTGRFSLKQK